MNMNIWGYGLKIAQNPLKYLNKIVITKFGGGEEYRVLRLASVNGRLSSIKKQNIFFYENICITSSLAR